MVNRFKRIDAEKIETEKKERIVQTYLIIATLLVAFNQNIMITLNNTTGNSTASLASNYILVFFTIFVISILIYNTLLTLTHDEIYLKNTKNFVAIIASSCLSSILVYYIIIQGSINPANLSDNIINPILSVAHTESQNYVLGYMKYSMFIYFVYYIFKSYLSIDEPVRRNVTTVIELTFLAMLIIIPSIFYFINFSINDLHILIVVYLILSTLISLPLLFIHEDGITISFKRSHYYNMKILFKKIIDMYSIENSLYTIIIIVLQFSVLYTINAIWAGN